MIKHGNYLQYGRHVFTERERRTCMKVKRGIITLIFFALISVFLPSQFVITHALSDIDGHWEEETLQTAIEDHILEGYPDGTYRPDETITRAEFMALVNRTFSFTEKQTINTFSDVDPNQWYADVIATAVAAGYIEGFTDGTMKPESIITRQETAVIVARLLEFVPNEKAADHFSDRIPSWSKGHVGAAYEHGIMIGLSENYFGVTKPLTRAEAVVTLSRIKEKYLKQTFDQPGTYGNHAKPTAIKKDVYITSSDITLQHYIIEGDLIITESVGDGDVYLDHVTVKGTTMIQGGGEDSIHVNDSQLNKVVVNKSNHKVRIATKGQTNINLVIVNSGAKLEDVDGGSASVQQVIVEAPKGSEVILTGHYRSVTIESEDNLIHIAQGSTVDELTVNKKAEIKGTGTIKTSEINSDGVTMEIKPAEMVVKQGVKAPEIKTNQPAPGSSSGGSSSGGQPSSDLVMMKTIKKNSRSRVFNQVKIKRS